MTDTRTDTPRQRPLLAVPEGSQILRLIPSLAEEMGHLQKALVLPQVAFWIGRSKIHRDGRFWARLSIRWMQRYAFKFWSVTTINRWITRLVEDGYLIEGEYNRHPHDQTRWLALNPDGLARLKSVAVIWQEVFQNDTPPSQNGTGVFQNDTRMYRNDTNKESESKNQSKEGNQESSHPTPHPDDDEDSNPEDKKPSIQAQLDPSGKFGPIPASLIADLQAQLDRLGLQAARAVVERCKASGGRTWTYVHTALANEPDPVRGSAGGQIALRSSEYADFITFGDEDEAAIEQRIARISAHEETRKRRSNLPAIQPTDRILHPWGDRTVLEAWEQTCAQLEHILDRATYDRLIGMATLVDFDPETGTFIVVIDHLYTYRNRNQIHFNTIYHELRRVYGDPKMDLRFLTRLDWLIRHPSPAHQPQGATA